VLGWLCSEHSRLLLWADERLLLWADERLLSVTGMLSAAGGLLWATEGVTVGMGVPDRDGASEPWSGCSEASDRIDCDLSRISCFRLLADKIICSKSSAESPEAVEAVEAVLLTEAAGSSKLASLMNGVAACIGIGTLSALTISAAGASGVSTADGTADVLRTGS
jgi:hypothetical protein